MSRGLPSMTALLGLLAIAGLSEQRQDCRNARRFGPAHARIDYARRPRRPTGPAEQQSRRCWCRWILSGGARRTHRPI